MRSPGTPDRLCTAAEPIVVALAATGDDKAFEELIRRRQGSIRGLLNRLCGERAMADDLAQETFLRAWQKLGSLKSPGAFGGWLKRIAVNLFLQQRRRADFARTGSYPEHDQFPDKTRSGIPDPSARLDLEKALTGLRPIQRLCVVLSHGERMSHGEICSITGLPLGTVKSHISRGSRRLRQILNAYRDDIP